MKSAEDRTNQILTNPGWETLIATTLRDCFREQPALRLAVSQTEFQDTPESIRKLLSFAKTRGISDLVFIRQGTGIHRLVHRRNPDNQVIMVTFVPENTSSVSSLAEFAKRINCHPQKDDLIITIPEAKPGSGSIDIFLWRY